MNSHKMTMSWIAIVCFAGLLAACGGEDAKDAVEAATDAAKEAAVAAEEAAGEAADAAAAAAGEAAEEVTGAAAVTLCKELAGKESWIDALGVCERAHEAAPDDMAVEHALQQAQAAAKAGS